jgi:hypothetical protein
MQSVLLFQGLTKNEFDLHILQKNPEEKNYGILSSGSRVVQFA